MIFGKRKKRERTGNPSWLKWLVMIFIAYAIFVNYSERRSNPTSPVAVVEGLQQGNVPADVVNEDVALRADFGRYILPPHITIGTEIHGQGELAQCGQTATVSVKQLQQGDASQPPETHTVQVGLPDDGQDWPIAIAAMQVDGTRNIAVVTNNADGENSIARYQLGLSRLEPVSGPEYVAFQASDREVGKIHPVTCGEHVEVGLTLYGSNGQMIYHTPPEQSISFTVGEHTLFYGLHRSVLGMKRGGTRSAIIPPAYAVLRNAEAYPDLQAALTESGMIIADITLKTIK